MTNIVAVHILSLIQCQNDFANDFLSTHNRNASKSEICDVWRFKSFSCECCRNLCEYCYV